MLDGRTRALITPALATVAARLSDRGLTAGAVTAAGLVVGIGACVAAALGVWSLALGLWLVNRILDGLDGAIARHRGPTDLGGLLDFLADFVVYGGFVVGVAIALEDTRVACVVLLALYLLNNVALLSFASLIEKRRMAFGDERSLRFTAGLAEGTETIVAYVLICLAPAHAQAIVWAFAVIVAITVLQRVRLAVVTLGAPTGDAGLSATRAAPGSAARRTSRARSHRRLGRALPPGSDRRAPRSTPHRSCRPPPPVR